MCHVRSIVASRRAPTIGGGHILMQHTRHREANKLSRLDAHRLGRPDGEEVERHGELVRLLLLLLFRRLAAPRDAPSTAATATAKAAVAVLAILVVVVVGRRAIGATRAAAAAAAAAAADSAALVLEAVGSRAIDGESYNIYTRAAGSKRRAIDPFSVTYAPIAARVSVDRGPSTSRIDRRRRYLSSRVSWASAGSSIILLQSISPR